MTQDTWTDVRVLDLPGRYGRNAVFAAGDVQGLEPPELSVEPLGHAGEIAQELDTMRFRAWRQGA